MYPKICRYSINSIIILKIKHSYDRNQVWLLHTVLYYVYIAICSYPLFPRYYAALKRLLHVSVTHPNKHYPQNLTTW